MQFKNEKDYAQFFKIKDKFVSVEPGETIEINRQEVAGLTRVEESEKTFEKQFDQEVSETPVPEKKTEKELKNMTKDEINDYAALIGYKELNTNMLKKEMIKNVLEYHEKN